MLTSIKRLRNLIPRSMHGLDWSELVMKNYTICTQPDQELFKRQCIALEKHIPNLVKEDLLKDVDGSIFQKYHHTTGMVRVCNDNYIGCLYIESEFDLEPYFN